MFEYMFGISKTTNNRVRNSKLLWFAKGPFDKSGFLRDRGSLGKKKTFQ